MKYVFVAEFKGSNSRRRNIEADQYNAGLISCCEYLVIPTTD
jgi:hypothetical protein